METKYKIVTGVYLALALALSAIHITYIIRHDTNKMEKYSKVIVPLIYSVGFLMYLLALYYFAQDDTYMIHILFGVVMLICLPATLFSTSVAMIVGGNV